MTDANQASEDEQAMQHICQQTGEHYYASESIPGGLIHWIRICMTCGHKDDKDLNEQVKTLIRTEKLKLLAEVRERVGEGYPYCLNNPGCPGTHCNKCWVCRYGNNDEYVQGYESAQDEIAKTLTRMEAEL